MRDEPTTDLIRKFCRVDMKGNTLLTPFIVNEEKKILYFHIAKTGGTTVVNTLRRHGLDDGVLSAKHGDFVVKKDCFTGIAEDWNKYFKFTFVRNKYDLLVSLWQFNRQHFKKTGKDFASFVSNYVVPSKDEYDYWIDQYYLTQPNLFDRVCRFENFDEEFCSVCKEIGIKYDGRCDNVGPYDHKVHYSAWYNPDIQGQVYDKFRREIDYFGFENPLHKP